MQYKVDWSRTSTNKGYKIVYAPEHPRAWASGYFYEHVILMEQHIGRLIDSKEHVHHRNHNRLDNRIENLELLTAKEHAAHHAAARPPSIIELDCAECGVTFSRRGNQRSENKGYTNTFCSRRCNGKYQRKKQLDK